MSEPLALGQVLSDRFRIERELGRGASAVVYLARDPRHGWQVAVKVRHPDPLVDGSITASDLGLRESSPVTGPPPLASGIAETVRVLQDTLAPRLGGVR